MNEVVLPALNSLNLGTLAPMAIAVIGALSIILTDVFNKDKHKSLYVIIVVLFLLFDLFTLLAYSGQQRGVFDMMLLDGISILSQVIIIVASIFFIFFGLSKLRFQDYRYAEYFALYLIAVAAFQFMVSTDSLVLIFVGLETASLALYTIIAMHNRMVSIEAAVKYFTMGAVAGAFFVFGSMLFYGVTGSLEMAQIGQFLVEHNNMQELDFGNYSILLLAFVFMFAAIGFKLSLFPYHIWVPDIYQGSTSAVAGFLSVVPKMAGFIVALRFFEMFSLSNDILIQTMLYVTVILTMTIPNLIALQQDDIKRMLAYSSISNTGMAMASVIIGTNEAYSALFLFWVLFAITNFGAFGMLWLNRGKEYQDYKSPYAFVKFSGLAQRAPFTASMFGLFLFSLTGLPPFALFWGKFYVVSSAVNAGYIFLAFAIIINSVIASYYYLKPISYMFLRNPEEGKEAKIMENATVPMKSVVGISVFLTIVAILYIEPLLQVINSYLAR